MGEEQRRQQAFLYQQQQQRMQQEAILRQQQFQQQQQQHSNDWYYQDPQGRVQGPFNSDDMRDWYQNGYFKPNLPVRQGNNNRPFVQLAVLYPDLRRAFQSRPQIHQQQQRGNAHQVTQQQM